MIVNIINNIFTGEDLVNFGGQQTSFQSVANFTAGYQGAAVGLPAFALVAGPGLFQDPNTKGPLVTGRLIGYMPNCLSCGSDVSVAPVITAGDDPYDSWWVRAGIAFYNVYGEDYSHFNEETLANFLKSYSYIDYPTKSPIQPQK